LFLPIIIICVAELHEKNYSRLKVDQCSNRCNRILKRSMNAVKEHPENAANILMILRKSRHKNQILQNENFDINPLCWLANLALSLYDFKV